MATSKEFKECLVRNLQEQDEQMKKIQEAREVIIQIAKNNGCYNEVREMLFSDGKSHASFQGRKNFPRDKKLLTNPSLWVIIKTQSRKGK